MGNGGLTMANAAQSQVMLAGPEGEPLIRKTPGVCGGDACIRDTRIMVWLLVALKRQGQTDAALLESYPGLTGADLAAAWQYARQHPEEIEEAIAAN
jgi:uncharacterized protein (DUF433 family)